MPSSSNNNKETKEVSSLSISSSSSSFSSKTITKSSKLGSSTPFQIEGRGVTNYDVSKPSYEFTTSTTEFDDQLMKRNIVSFEQCMIAKGATPLQARELHIQKIQNNNHHHLSDQSLVEKKGDRQKADENEDHDDEDDDDGFLAKYRSMRIAQLKSEQKTKQEKLLKRGLYGNVFHITRSQWKSHVNESSSDGTYVMVYLSFSPNPDPYPELNITSSYSEIARDFPFIKFVQIPFQEAISNYPENKLPTFFIYHRGSLRFQLIGIHHFLAAIQEARRVENLNRMNSIVKFVLENKMREWGMIPSQLEGNSDDESELDQRDNCSDCSSDYDDVD